MTVRVGINGFGRIGRNFFRAVVASGALVVSDVAPGATVLGVPAREAGR